MCFLKSFWLTKASVFVFKTSASILFPVSVAWSPELGTLKRASVNFTGDQVNEN